MSTTDSIEVSAATVEQAIKDALAELHAQEQDVVIEVLATPRAGVLGLGSRQAKVRVSRHSQTAATSGVQSPPPAPPIRPAAPARPPAANPAPQQRQEPRQSRAEEGTDAAEGPRKTADLQAQVGEAVVILSRILELMGEKAETHEIAADAESIELEIKGDGSGILIGRHGQTLDALEYLVNRVIARRIRDAVPIMLETESYRARRRQQLHRMALSMGEKAKREHEPVKLDPMPPRDRRIVHLALKEDPLITTRSTGDGFMRSIEIVPVEARREGRGGRRREREPRPTTEAIGEQGGFKRGQKRIV
jgi:spoIIIJ-associated protein